VTDTNEQGRDDFTWLVNDFVGRVHGVSHAMIMSADGLSLAVSDTVGLIEGEQLAAIASGMLSLARNSAALFGRGTCEQIIVRLSVGYLLFMGIDTNAGLAVLTDADCDMKVVGYEMTQFVLHAGHALTPQARVDLRQILAGRQL
jgi:predicted regulator of Ras-like GTPase activity (Roadblock/LC7/MglB family)